MQPLISPEELLRQPMSGRVLLDVRSGPQAHPQYLVRHLAGAHWVDLEHQLAAPTGHPAEGGRHPLPPLAEFAALLGRLGIAPGTAVVVYDDKAGANAAARLWWMLRAVGHANVQVLDGGLPAAEAAGYPTSTGPETATPLPAYPATSWQLPTASVAEVEQATQPGAGLVIDVRDAARYRGEVEPIDLIAGHIPGAVNAPFSGNLTPEGRFKEATALRQQYETLLAGRPAAEAIVHCGSGVTACHTLLGFAQAGLPIPRLYVGSWSEWSNQGRAVGLG